MVFPVEVRVQIPLSTSEKRVLCIWCNIIMLWDRYVTAISRMNKMVMSYRCLIHCQGHLMITVYKCIEFGNIRLSRSSIPWICFSERKLNRFVDFLELLPFLLSKLYKCLYIYLWNTHRWISTIRTQQYGTLFSMYSPLQQWLFMNEKN